MRREVKNFWKRYTLTQEDRECLNEWELEQIALAKAGEWFDESGFMERIRDWNKRGV